jgi:large subunit ribosomal protein L15
MQLHQIKPFHKTKSRMRVGRGGKRGTYSGRGMKGQKSRAGKKPRPGFAGGDTPFFKRLPKQRGSRGSLKIRVGSKPFNFKNKILNLNLEVIDKKFKEGEVISPKTLFEKKLIRKFGNRLPKVKILAHGTLKKSFKFVDILTSKKALVEIKKSGTLIEKKSNKAANQKIKKEIEKSVSSKVKK